MGDVLTPEELADIEALNSLGELEAKNYAKSYKPGTIPQTVSPPVEPSTRKNIVDTVFNEPREKIENKVTPTASSTQDVINDVVPAPKPTKAWSITEDGPLAYTLKASPASVISDTNNAINPPGSTPFIAASSSNPVTNYVNKASIAGVLSDSTGGLLPKKKLKLPWQ
jgi:hypothetical protein